ncbi:hypothetical protein HD597_006774 [Nonomuraea thailandensis]|uniref:Uncharacterized protein n=1 Tax=Nonomuraea thailandensis TaxID=1188745 RepID=A0A9X2K4S7_9ACTN|nr:hypothetical protein [Nonomuraea thailandensis]MCP2359754.1 hypothetical protein [Nonomuraea thailandensis]
MSTWQFGVLHLGAVIGLGAATAELQLQHALWWSALLYAVLGWLSGGKVVSELRWVRPLPKSRRTRAVKLVLAIPAATLGLWVNPVTFFSRTLGVVELQFMLWGPIALFGLCIAAASWYFFRDFR